MPSAQDGTGVVKIDSWLEPHSDALRHRYKGFRTWVDTLAKDEEGLAKFSQGYEKMGFIVSPNGDITYREWAPNATAAHLMGDFSMIPSMRNILTCLRQLGPSIRSNDTRQLRCMVCNTSCCQWPDSYPSQYESQGSIFIFMSR
jgi:hypothetical protein